MFGTGFNFVEKKIWDHFIISDSNFELFQDNLSEDKIKNLYLKLKLYEKKGYVIYQKYFISMKNIFDSDLIIKENNTNKKNSSNSENSSCMSESDNNSNKNNYFDEIYDLIFKRFREIKCIIKNNKNIFYLTDLKQDNYVNSYNIVCALTIFLKTSFENKIKLLFDLTDNDEDGYLNKNEIEYMITTINQIFGEEVRTINTNSSILTQSLTNLKVNNILYELLYGQGELYNNLVKEQFYIPFETIYKSIKKIKNYKYRIIPCFINFKDCLYSHKMEKMINVKEKHKKDFINISSELVLDQTKNINKHFIKKKFSLNNLNEVIKPIKIENEIYIHKEKKHKKLKLNSPEKFRRSIKRRKSFIKSDRSLKELIKNSTIFSDDETNLNYNSDNNLDDISNKKNFSQYAFLAHFSDIKNIEVEPGIIRFLPNEIDKNDNYNNNNRQKIRMEPKTPDFRKKPKNFINIRNKQNKLIDSLNEISEVVNKESKRFLCKFKTNKKYENKFMKKNESKNVIKNIRRPPHQDSFSTKNLKSYLNINYQRKQSRSIHMKNQKRFFFKKNLNPERYKTLKEIFDEINNQKKNFNYDSINHINNEIIKEYKKIKVEMNKFRNKSTIFKEHNKNSFISHTFFTPKNKYNKSFFRSIKY